MWEFSPLTPPSSAPPPPPPPPPSSEPPPIPLPPEPLYSISEDQSVQDQYYQQQYPEFYEQNQNIQYAQQNWNENYTSLQETALPLPQDASDFEHPPGVTITSDASWSSGATILPKTTFSGYADNTTNWNQETYWPAYDTTNSSVQTPYPPHPPQPADSSTWNLSSNVPYEPRQPAELNQNESSYFQGTQLLNQRDSSINYTYNNYSQPIQTTTNNSAYNAYENYQDASYTSAPNQIQSGSWSSYPDHSRDQITYDSQPVTNYVSYDSSNRSMDQTSEQRFYDQNQWNVTDSSYQSYYPPSHPFPPAPPSDSSALLRDSQKTPLADSKKVPSFNIHSNPRFVSERVPFSSAATAATETNTELKSEIKKETEIGIKTNSDYISNRNISKGNGVMKVVDFHPPTPSSASHDSTRKESMPSYLSVAKSSITNQSVRPPEPAFQSNNFPPSLSAYVERALARCKTDEQKKTCQDQMKQKITNAFKGGVLFSHNWDIEPLPIVTPGMTPGNQKESETHLKTDPADSSYASTTSPSKKKHKSRWEPMHITVMKKRQARQNGLSKAEESTTPSTSYNPPLAKPVSKGKSQLFTNQTASFGNASHELGEAEDEKISNRKQSHSAHKSNKSTEKSSVKSSEENQRREKRAKRFESAMAASSSSPKEQILNPFAFKRKRISMYEGGEDIDGPAAMNDTKWVFPPLRGTSKQIEKCYLRLTSAPDPSTVRPVEVLEKSLEMILTCSKSYLFRCDQLKSIRQDLTVQHVRNPFTVKVYETHARMALEAGDFSEYNQCQAQLLILYSEGVCGCVMEFTAYGLLYSIVHKSSHRSLQSAMARLSHEVRSNPAVKHALSVRKALFTMNYKSYFQLYECAPNLGAIIMKIHVDKMRFEAVKVMSKAYRPSLPVSFISRTLGFEPSSRLSAMAADIAGDCARWLREHGCLLLSADSTTNPNVKNKPIVTSKDGKETITVHDEDSFVNLVLDTKASLGRLFIPEPVDVVGHGDPNLAVVDFFSRSS